MSGYSDMYKDQIHREFLDNWVPADDPKLDDCPEEFRDMYRFTLARARCAEAAVKSMQTTLQAFKKVLDAAH